MKLSDYVFQFVRSLGVKHVFYLPGGGAMHLDDSLGHTEGLIPVCMLHEQACAIASEAYARISESYAVCVVTSGPGATNALTGLLGAWLDATPVLFLSGQVKRADRVNGQGIRQFGIQEVSIVDMVRSVTKYAVQIEDPKDVRYELEKAASLARTGKPGPVWLDIPLDIQASQIDPDTLHGFEEPPAAFECSTSDISETIHLFNEAKRPLLLLGHGVRMAKAIPEMRELIELLQVPVMTTWNGVDLIEDDHPLFYGRPGAVGHRHANFIQQNADFVLTIGTRLNLLSTGYDFDSFLRHAKHVMVEIDEHELRKCSVHPALAVHADAKSFLARLLARKRELDVSKRANWLAYCRDLKEKYPLFIPEQVPDAAGINPYTLINRLTRRLGSEDIYQFTSSGTAADIAMYAFKVKKGQRAFLTKGLASMGYDLPACIGSCIASGGRRTVCVTGDGGFLMNIQELETLRRLDLPIKILIIDNDGYGMIYNSQAGNFKRLTGCTSDSGLSLPSLAKVAQAFGIATSTICDEAELDEKLDALLASNGPHVCIVKAFIGQRITPRQTNYMRPDGQMASRPLEDMSPLLAREEYQSNMISEIDRQS